MVIYILSLYIFCSSNLLILFTKYLVHKTQCKPTPTLGQEIL